MIDAIFLIAVIVTATLATASTAIATGMEIITVEISITAFTMPARTTAVIIAVIAIRAQTLHHFTATLTADTVTVTIATLTVATEIISTDVRSSTASTTGVRGSPATIAAMSTLVGTAGFTKLSGAEIIGTSHNFITTIATGAFTTAVAMATMLAELGIVWVIVLTIGAGYTIALALLTNLAENDEPLENGRGKFLLSIIGRG